MLSNHQAPLVVLFSHRTGNKIPSFPKDLKSLYGLTSRYPGPTYLVAWEGMMLTSGYLLAIELREILHALELPTEGLDIVDLQEALRKRMM